MANNRGQNWVSIAVDLGGLPALSEAMPDGRARNIQAISWSIISPMSRKYNQQYGWCGVAGFRLRLLRRGGEQNRDVSLPKR
jgi:hypothetical protein